jgi:hypothetical protein
VLDRQWLKAVSTGGRGRENRHIHACSNARLASCLFSPLSLTLWAEDMIEPHSQGRRKEGFVGI